MKNEIIRPKLKNLLAGRNIHFASVDEFIIFFNKLDISEQEAIQSVWQSFSAIYSLKLQEFTSQKKSEEINSRHKTRFFFESIKSAAVDIFDQDSEEDHTLYQELKKILLAYGNLLKRRQKERRDEQKSALRRLKRQYSSFGGGDLETGRDLWNKQEISYGDADAA